MNLVEIYSYEWCGQITVVRLPVVIESSDSGHQYHDATLISELLTASSHESDVRNSQSQPQQNLTQIYNIMIKA